MKKQWKNIGVGLFVLTIIWYAVGNYWLKLQQDERDRLARERHPAQLSFASQNVDNVTIELDIGTRYGGYTGLHFAQSAEKINVLNKNPKIAVSGEQQGQHFYLKVVPHPQLAAQENSKDRIHLEYSDLMIHLPATVKHITFKGRVWLTIFDSQLTTGALGLSLTGCSASLEIKNSTFNQLSIITDGVHSEQRECDYSNDPHSVTFNKDSFVKQLDISMPLGELKFEAQTLPTKARLVIGEQVEITARSAFWKIAQIVDSH